MPFANADGGVVLRLENLGNRRFLRVQSLSVRREKNAQVVVVDVHVYAPRVATREQTGARRRAHAAGRIEAR